MPLSRQTRRRKQLETNELTNCPKKENKIKGNDDTLTRLI